MKFLNFNRSLLLFLILFIFPCGIIKAAVQEIEIHHSKFLFDIKYLGITVTKVEMTDISSEGKGVIEVEASSVSIGNMLFRINNTYRIEYVDSYLPSMYSKSIEQRNFSLTKKTSFLPAQNKIETKSGDEPATEIFFDGGQIRDFFSALLLLRKIDVPYNPLEIMIYANNNIWSAKITYMKHEVVSNRESVKYRIDFQQKSNNEKQRSDVLTNNIVKDDGTLFIWLSKDEQRLPVKAEYDTSPFSIFWSLENYQISIETVFPPSNYEKEN